MKGIITLNIEVDYAEMLNQDNLQAIHQFTGATSVEDMIKIHMDGLSHQLVAVVEGKPLVRYNLDGRLRKDVTPEQEQIEQPAEVLPEPEEAEVIDLVPADVARLIDLVGKLDEDLQNVSINLGIPQSIKINSEMVKALQLKSGNKEGIIVDYTGFPVQEEGMETPYMIVYKTYSGTEIKFFEPEVK